jgi:hypothetical protein
MKEPWDNEQIKDIDQDMRSHDNINTCAESNQRTEEHGDQKDPECGPKTLYAGMKQAEKCRQDQGGP